MAKKAIVMTAVKIRIAPAVQPESYGFQIKLVRRNGKARIISGCRNVSFAEAKKHWGKNAKMRPYKGLLACTERIPGCNCRNDQGERGRAMVKLLPILRKRALSYGWNPS